MFGTFYYHITTFHITRLWHKFSQLSSPLPGTNHSNCVIWEIMVWPYVRLKFTTNGWRRIGLNHSATSPLSIFQKDKDLQQITLTFISIISCQDTQLLMLICRVKGTECKQNNKYGRAMLRTIFVRKSIFYPIFFILVAKFDKQAKAIFLLHMNGLKVHSPHKIPQILFCNCIWDIHLCIYFNANARDVSASCSLCFTKQYW